MEPTNTGAIILKRAARFAICCNVLHHHRHPSASIDFGALFSSLPLKRLKKCIHFYIVQDTDERGRRTGDPNFEIDFAFFPFAIGTEKRTVLYTV